MRMLIGIRAGPAARKINTALLLAIGAIALVVPRGDMAGQPSTKTAEQLPPMFTAIDLTPRGRYSDAHASGISGEWQVGDAYVGFGTTHALLWRSSAASMVDLNPAGFGESGATGICGNQQVGKGTSPGKNHALLWRGSAASVEDLTPSGFDAEARATSGDQQVGIGNTKAMGQAHALLWRSSAASVVDLHPRGFVWSFANAVAGGQQVGMGGLPSTESRIEHALLWRGSAATVVDLHPSGFDISHAWGVGGGQQVGLGVRPVPRELWAKYGSSEDRALLWRGTAASVVDLTPSGLGSSRTLVVYPGIIPSVAFATNGEEQVGRAGGRAVLWRGSAASIVDLHAFLPPGFGASQAMAIDANGNVVGYASNPPAPDSHAFLWKRNVPKPTTSQGQSMGRCK